MAKIGRNDLCSCGSGKMYKRCCGDKKRRIDQAARVAPFRVRDARDKLLAHTITLETFEAVIADILEPRIARITPIYKCTCGRCFEDVGDDHWVECPYCGNSSGITVAVEGVDYERKDLIEVPPTNQNDPVIDALRTISAKSRKRMFSEIKV